MRTTRIPLRSIAEKTFEEINKIKEKRMARAWPIFMLYSFSVILLLRISQFILGWTF